MIAILNPILPISLLVILTINPFKASPLRYQFRSPTLNIFELLINCNTLWLFNAETLLRGLRCHTTSTPHQSILQFIIIFVYSIVYILSVTGHSIFSVWIINQQKQISSNPVSVVVVVNYLLRTVSTLRGIYHFTFPTIYLLYCFPNYNMDNWLQIF